MNYSDNELIYEAYKSKEEKLYNSLSKDEREYLHCNRPYSDSRKYPNFVKRFKEFDENKNLKGYADLLRFSNKPKTLYITYAVSPNFRRQGVASRLIEKCKQFAIKNGFKLQYWADAKNDASNAVAKKYNWPVIYDKSDKKGYNVTL